MNNLSQQVPAPTMQTLQDAVVQNRQLFVSQKKEMAELFLGIETKNSYTIYDDQKRQLGMILENGGGFWGVVKRLLFRSHRGFEIGVFDQQQQAVFHLVRKFFFIFSDLMVLAGNGAPIGSIHRRFGIIHKKYDLKDPQGMIFARISSPIWRLWTFPIKIPQHDQPVAEISKKWQGVMKEMFTDADTFMIDYGQMQWTPVQKAVIFAAAISIDFDFFENNSGNQGGLLSFGN